ncbi:peptide ligase PGM1-related protein [soil metagenome]
MTLRRRDEQRTLVVLSSMSVAVPDELLPLLPAYEERYLIYVLGLARAPRTQVIYLTSQPILPRMLDYYLGLIPGLDRHELHSRLIPISVGDWSHRPLTQKILERPRLMDRMRAAIADPNAAVLLPFVTTDLEARLAVELGIPVYGPHPSCGGLGTKTGSRQIFATAGVPFPRGANEVRTVSEVATALTKLAGDGAPDEAVVKLDDSVSGYGNAIVDLRGASDRRQIERRVRSLRPEDQSLDASAFLDRLEGESGIVEERISGTDFRSPSVQLRNSPEGGTEVLSTHDQILGGHTGQTYFGCRFPADPGYGPALAEHGTAIAEALARQGVIGRFAIDFVVTRSNGSWGIHAVEINLRNGGTTHPALTLLALTEGDYQPDQGCYIAGGVSKHYVATDHLETPGLATLTPDDVLDVAEQNGLVWDDASMTGLVFHMVSAVGVAGRVGVTAIADSPASGEALYRKTESTLADAVAR